MYYFSDPLCLGHEHAGQVSRGRVQRSPKQVWSPPAPNQSLYGRPESNYDFSTGQLMGPSGYGEDHHLGLDVFQACKI